jgi:hypothetical protein
MVIFLSSGLCDTLKDDCEALLIERELNDSIESFMVDGVSSLICGSDMASLLWVVSDSVEEMELSEVFANTFIAVLAAELTRDLDSIGMFSGSIFFDCDSEADAVDCWCRTSDGVIDGDDSTAFGKVLEQLSTFIFVEKFVELLDSIDSV